MQSAHEIYKNLSSLFSLDIDHLAELPCYVFWKDSKGTYLGYNNFGAINLGFASGDEIEGKSDFNIFPHDIAFTFVENDHDVIQKRSQNFFPEPGVLKNNLPVVFMSYKMPIFSSDGSVIGILGLAFTKEKNAEGQSGSELKTKFNYPHAHHTHESTLTEREDLCIRYLCKGLKLKEIARQLKISPRTVETYLDRAKCKMGCKNKAELMLSFLQIFGSI